MISDIQARQFAKLHFPNAAEKLAEYLEVIIRQSPLIGCDGWCLTIGTKSIIRINSKLALVRRRFTLAHELGHLILGIPTVVGESFEDMLRSDSDDERRVNDLASAILIPSDIVRSSLQNLPVVAADLKKLAKIAKISELAAAVRVCNLASEIGLLNASVVLFNGNQIRWQWSKTLSMTDAIAARLLAEARKVAPNAVRRLKSDGNVIVASTVENPLFGSATLFVQVLPASLGMKQSRHERRAQLEIWLFENEPKLRQQVSGMLGAHKCRAENRSSTESVANFWQRYDERLRHTALNTKTGREYVQLRISEWF